MNVSEFLTQHALDFADRPALEDGDRIVSYSELEAMVGRMAANLRGAGVETEELVAVILPDTPEHIAVIYALMRIGAVHYPVNFFADETSQH
jgi:acyl-CoA synthetase (AMP-forming)/AMP-acid ligase II